MMWGNGMGWGGWLLMTLTTVAFWAVVVFGIVALFRGSGGLGPRDGRRDRDARQILDGGRCGCGGVRGAARGRVGDPGVVAARAPRQECQRRSDRHREQQPVAVSAGTARGLCRRLRR